MTTLHASCHLIWLLSPSFLVFLEFVGRLALFYLSWYTKLSDDVHTYIIGPHQCIYNWWYFVSVVDPNFDKIQRNVNIPRGQSNWTKLKEINFFYKFILLLARLNEGNLMTCVCVYVLSDYKHICVIEARECINDEVSYLINVPSIPIPIKSNKSALTFRANESSVEQTSVSPFAKPLRIVIGHLQQRDNWWRSASVDRLSFLFVYSSDERRFGILQHLNVWSSLKNNRAILSTSCMYVRTRLRCAVIEMDYATNFDWNFVNVAIVEEKFQGGNVHENLY